MIVARVQTTSPFLRKTWGATERFGDGGDARCHFSIRMVFAVDGTLTMAAQIEQEFCSACHHRTKRQVFVLGHQIARAHRQEADQTQPNRWIALEQLLKISVRNIPRRAILNRASGWTCPEKSTNIPAHGSLSW